MVTNAKEFPKTYYCRHMMPGIARYENFNPVTKKTDEEHLFIDVDALKQSAPSMVGKPIYVNHQKVNLATLEADADGYVTECFYNELDGWLWAKFLAVTDEAQNAVNRQWSVSNAYIPQEWDGAGSHLNVDYDKKIRKHNFTHLAIVPNPRYEDAKIFTPEQFKDYQAAKRSELDELQNSKPNKGHPMFKFFQKKDEELKNGLPADADLSTIEIELEGGKRMALSEIINAVKKNDEDEAEKKKAKDEEDDKKNAKVAWNDDTEVTVGKDKMPMKDLMNKYNAMCKKNDDKKAEEKKTEDEDKEKKEKENALAKAKEDEEKKNRDDKMKEMLNAHTKGKIVPISTVIDKKKRGSEMFGSAKK